MQLTPGATKSQERHLRRKDGSETLVEVRAKRLSGDLSNLSMLVIRDISERVEAERTLRETESRLHQAQKLKAVSELAAGIAHDFNNLLSAVMGNAGILQMTLPEDGPAQEIVGEIELGPSRGAALVRQLLAFSRRQELEPQIIDIEAAVAEFIPMVRAVIGGTIRIRTSATKGVWQVNVDPTQLEQVLMNLVVNARDAMPPGGEVRIDVRNAELDDDEARKLTAERGEYVILRVSDTGTGMQPETIAQVFEPFFTTKPSHEGTGLGLATIHGIIEQSGGHIAVESEVGGGTTFTILFPRTGAGLPA